LRKEIEAAFARSGTNGIEQGQGRLWLAIGRVENPRRTQIWATWCAA
jgi:hypothetical protein